MTGLAWIHCRDVAPLKAGATFGRVGRLLLGGFGRTVLRATRVLGLPVLVLRLSAVPVALAVRVVVVRLNPVAFEGQLLGVSVALGLTGASEDAELVHGAFHRGGRVALAVAGRLRALTGGLDEVADVVVQRGTLRPPGHSGWRAQACALL